MKVCMLKDVEKVGMAGQIVEVTDGYATNFLFPRKLALEVTSAALPFYEARKQKERVSAEVLSSKAAMLAERIKNLHLTLKEKTHDNGKLYGAVSADQVVELLKSKDIVVTRKQIDFPKTIKEIGEHPVIVKLSAKLKPQFLLTITALK